MTYEVKYKTKFFWHTIKKVKGDFIAQDLPTKPRVFVLEDETRIEVPTENTIFKFSKERFIVIKQSMEKELGQKLNV